MPLWRRHRESISCASTPRPSITRVLRTSRRTPGQWALQSSAQWGIDVLPAWNVSAAPQTPIRVAIIDSGIKQDLDEFAGRIWSKECLAGQVPGTDHCEISGNGLDDDGNGYADDVTGITTASDYPLNMGAGGIPAVGSDHATKVAAIVAANSSNGVLIAGVSGIAPVTLMNLSLGASKGCAELAEALLYATVEGADIANISLGVRPDPLISEALFAAMTRDGGGVTVVASAGNNNTRVTENYFQEGATYPAWFPGVISVGGSAQSGRRWLSSAGGSNYGVGLDLVAPADSVATITFSSPTATTATPVAMSGTSASAAIVSGVAALLLSHHPTTRVARMTAWLRATVTDLPDPEGTGAVLTGEDLYSGAGLVNASRSITSEPPDPVVVDLMVEKIEYGKSDWHTGFVANGVVGRPDLGITVLGPVVRWQLDYGVGDWPTSWVPIAVEPQYIGTELDVARTSPGRGIDVESGHNWLETDSLTNRQVYTLRLSATDDAGRRYTAYDWFMPLRAMLQYPAKNDAVPIHWGWPEVTGVVDIRSGSTLPAPGPGRGLSTSRRMGHGNHSRRPVVRFTDPRSEDRASRIPDGPRARLAEVSILRLDPGKQPDPGVPVAAERRRPPCHGADRPLAWGVTTTDTQDIILDASAFSARTGWPLA